MHLDPWSINCTLVFLIYYHHIMQTHNILLWSFYSLNKGFILDKRLNPIQDGGAKKFLYCFSALTSTTLSLSLSQKSFLILSFLYPSRQLHLQVRSPSGHNFSSDFETNCLEVWKDCHSTLLPNRCRYY